MTRLHSASTSVAASSSPQRLVLPRSLLPITLGVFAQMLHVGEGISLSSLPLYLTARGATPVTVGLAISCFSVCQMTFAPILVGLSSRAGIGRSRILRLCLGGAAASSLLIAFSTSVYGVIVGRALAGVFAACVPVAQSAVTDVMTTNENDSEEENEEQEQLLALGLSRVSAASQLGVVVGPLASAAFQHGFERIGVAPDMCLPAVFILNAANALFVLGQMTIMDRRAGNNGSLSDATVAAIDDSKKEGANANETVQAKDATSHNTFSLAQPMLRTITIIVGWTAILSNSIYGLFAPRAMGFQQAQLSATYSTAAILMVAMQIIFVKLVAKIGEHRACSLGILAAGLGIGGQSLIRFQPLHSILYFMNRAGAAIADTSTAALVASSSANRDDRSRNLALLTSTRAAARIFSPLVSGKLFELSMHSSVAPGALPFVAAGCLCMAVAPFPSILKRAQRRRHKKQAA